MNEFLMRRWPGVLGALLLAYGLVLAIGSRQGFPQTMDYGFGMPFLSDRPVGEDGFYMLTVAWYLADTGHLEYNFGTITTGIQPLATFVYALVAKVVQLFGGTRWTFVRWIIAFNVLLSLAFAYYVGAIARALVSDHQARNSAFALGAVMTLSSMWVFRAFTYGLETGLYLLLLSSLVLTTLAPGRISPAKLGLLGGITGLARIDFGIVYAFQLIWLFWNRRITALGAVGAGVLALAITAPWFIWVHSVTGSWSPSSGTASQTWILSDPKWLSRVIFMVKGLTFNLAPWVPSYDWDVSINWTLLSLLVLVGAAAWPARNTMKEGLVAVNRQAVSQLAAWGGSIFILVPVYLIAFWSWHFYGRYTTPFLLVTIPFFSLLIVMAGRSLKSFPAIVLMLCPIVFAVSAITQVHSGQMVLDFPLNAQLFEDSWASQRRIGAQQSGVLGFFHQNVVNLDGKIDAEALKSLRENRLGAYVERERIDVLVDWPENLQSVLQQTTGWGLCGKQPAGGGVFHRVSVCYERTLH